MILINDCIGKENAESYVTALFNIKTQTDTTILQILQIQQILPYYNAKILQSKNTQCNNTSMRQYDSATILQYYYKEDTKEGLYRYIFSAANKE